MSVTRSIKQAMVDFEKVFNIQPTKVILSQGTFDALYEEVKPLLNYSYKFTTNGKNMVMGLEIDIVPYHPIIEVR